MVQNPIMYDTWGGASNILVLEASEVKLPALGGFVLPTHFLSGSGNLTKSTPPFWGVFREVFGDRSKIWALEVPFFGT